jgi:4-amino-4-deoxy-L-arabinose transferase-like glycosyltransferase
MNRTTTSPILWIIGLSLLVHLPGLRSPLLDYQAYRQCQTASMARNYVRHGMHFLNPELDTEGKPARAGTEFPIYSYLLALLFKLFGIREISGRILSSVFAAVGAVFLYLFVRPRLDETRAFASAMAMSVIPIHLYFTRSVQPEPMALCGLLGFLCFTDRWLNRGGGPAIWAISVICGATAPLLKLPFIYLLLPLWLYLGWEAYERQLLLCPRLVGSLILMLLATWAWYHYAKTAPVGVLPLSAAEHWKNLRPIFTLKLWENHFLSRLPELNTTYPGLLFAIVGARALLREKKARFWGIWFAATALYIVLLGEYGQIHRYTELPFAPVCAVFIGTGIVAAWDAWPRALLIVLIAGIPVHAGLRIAHWYRWEYPWVFDARQKAAAHSGPNDLVITNTREHPVLLYYLDRYGFAPDLEETTTGVIPLYRSRGARLFITPADESWARHPELKAYFDARGTQVEQTPDYRIYVLK